MVRPRKTKKAKPATITIEVPWKRRLQEWLNARPEMTARKMSVNANPDHPDLVWSILAKPVEPSYPTIIRLCEANGIDPVWLMHGEVASATDRSTQPSYARFRDELHKLLARHTMGAPSKTKPAALALFLTKCLAAYDEAAEARKR